MDENVIVNEDKLFPAKDTSVKPETELPPFDEFEKKAESAEPPKDTKPEEKAVEKKNGNSRVPIPIRAGQLQASTDEQMFRVACQLLRGRAIPKWFQTNEQVYAAMVYLGRLGVPAETNLNCIAPIEGTMAIFGDLPLDLFISSKDYVFHDEYLFDAKYERICFENKNVDAAYIGAVCILQRKGQEKRSFTFTVEDAKKAGLWEKKSSSGAPLPWSLYPKIMLQRRARAWALKTVAPDLLKGTKIMEYEFDAAPDLKDVTPENPSTGTFISNKYGGEPSVQTVAPKLPAVEAEMPSGGELHPPKPVIEGQIGVVS